jgi:hypothetical protein
MTNIHPTIRAKHYKSAQEILQLDAEIAAQAVAALIELAARSGGGRGFALVVRSQYPPGSAFALDVDAKLEDRKYPGDYCCEGYAVSALTAVRDAIGGGL